MSEATYKKRVRIGIDTSTKGVRTPSCTLEMLDTDEDEVLERFKVLVAKVTALYPVEPA